MICDIYSDTKPYENVKVKLMNIWQFLVENLQYSYIWGQGSQGIHDQIWGNFFKFTHFLQWWTNCFSHNEHCVALCSPFQCKVGID